MRTGQLVRPRTVKTQVERSPVELLETPGEHTGGQGGGGGGAGHDLPAGTHQVGGHTGIISKVFIPTPEILSYVGSDDNININNSSFKL